jgi:hypothetical protein
VTTSQAGRRQRQRSSAGHYRPTESKYKGGAREHYVTYDLEQRTRGGGTAIYPKVKRVYIAGTVTGWEYGEFEKRSGRKARGVRIDYKQRRKGYERAGYTAHRRGTTYEVQPAQVGPVDQHFTRIVEIPDRAMNVQYRGTSLPAKYRRARQDIA